MKKVNAFVTIEYSLLLPVLLAVFTMLVCMGLYLHNQCVLQTSIYVLSVEGAQWKEQALYHEKFILVDDLQITYKGNGNQTIITGSGSMPNPLSILGLGKAEWKLEATSEVDTLAPGKILRLIKNTLNLLDGTEQKGGSEDDS